MDAAPALEDVLDDAGVEVLLAGALGVEVLLEVVFELLPHPATTRAATAATARRILGIPTAPSCSWTVLAV
jgi:hypothetical protein